MPEERDPKAEAEEIEAIAAWVRQAATHTGSRIEDANRTIDHIRDRAIEANRRLSDQAMEAAIEKFRRGDMQSLREQLAEVESILQVVAGQNQSTIADLARAAVGRIAELKAEFAAYRKGTTQDLLRITAEVDAEGYYHRCQQLEAEVARLRAKDADEVPPP